MSFPVSLKQITLTGTFLDGEGDPRGGVVTITLPTPIRSTGDDVVIPPFDLEIDLDSNGHFTVDIPATTDPDWIPNTAEYAVQAVFDEDFRKLWWSFPLPHDTAGDSLDLADVGNPTVGTPARSILQGTTQPLADGGYKGTWGAGVLYRAGDTVQHSSAVYGALKASSGVTPGTNAAIWKVYPGGGGGGAVDSVNGQTGDVVLTATDVGAQPVDGDLTAIAGLTATTDNIIQSVAGMWASRTPAQLKISLGLIKADVGLGNADNTSDANKPISTATQTALDLKANLAGPALTGATTAVDLTQSGRYLSTPDALTDAATIAVDASLGNDFTVTLGGNRTLGNPTNPVNGQKIMFAIRQDGTGNRTLTLGSAYRLGTDISSVVLSTAAGKTDYLGVRYNNTDSKWDVIAFLKGY